MKKNKNKKENLKICVHIPLYLDVNKKKQVQNFRKVCNSFLKFSKKVDIFVHTNKAIKFKSKKIKYLQYKFEKDHPYYLTWYPRKLMFKQRNSYDVFIYCEDDIYFSKQNFFYWLKNKDLCLYNNFNLGFLRVENKGKILYSADQITQSNQFVELGNKKFIVIKSPHCSFWIYDKNEFNNFTKTKYFHFKWELLSISGVLLIREMATYGWHGIDINGKDMERYFATIIPIKNNRFEKNSFIKHLTNNYSKNPAGLFGTFKVSQIISKNLKRFTPQTLFDKLIKKIKYDMYYYSRINLKKYFKQKLN